MSLDGSVNSSGGPERKNRAAGLFEKTRKTRVGSQFERTIGLICARDTRYFMTIVSDVLLIWVFLILLAWILNYLFPLAGDCNKAVGNCYETDPRVWLRLPLWLGATAWGSYRSTCAAAHHRFQHSAVVSALFILSLWLVLLYLDISAYAIAGSLCAFFLALYGGYRLALRRQHAVDPS